ncbi:uncharacterized protein V1478_010528 [Vespula squamosa]|uniref:Uncharacterized protein n=1 Tax=Vespula squamosa TaxID=30214 RepID=A0ABD2AIW9_VESSQ
MSTLPRLNRAPLTGWLSSTLELPATILLLDQISSLFATKRSFLKTRKNCLRFSSSMKSTSKFALHGESLNVKEQFSTSSIPGSDSRGNISISWVFINEKEYPRKESNMLSRLRLPINQFSKYITEKMSRNCSTSVSSDLKFQSSNIIQGSEIFNNSVGEIKNLNLFQNSKKTESITLKNKTNFRFSYKTTESKISWTKDTSNKESIITVDIETELFDVQHKMEPSYKELVYQEMAKPKLIVLENFNTSGPVL